MAICEPRGLFPYFHWKLLPFPMCCSALPFILFSWFLDCLDTVRGSSVYNSVQHQCTASVYNITTGCVWVPGCCTHWKICFPHHCPNLLVFYLSFFSGCTWGSLSESSGSFMIQQRFCIYCTKWKLINQGIGSSQSIINTCDKEKWCLCHTNNANTKLMEKLLFLIYYLMDFFSAVYITHYDINFNSYSLKSPWGGRGIQKNMLNVQPKNSYTLVQSNGLERNMITVPVTLGYSRVFF